MYLHYLVSFLLTLWQHHLFEWPDGYFYLKYIKFTIFITQKLELATRSDATGPWRYNYSGGALTLHQLHSVGVCVSYIWQSLSDITEQLLAGHQSGRQWTHSYQAASAQLATRKQRLHAMGRPSKRQPMNSLVSSCLGSIWLCAIWLFNAYKVKNKNRNNLIIWTFLDTREWHSRSAVFSLSREWISLQKKKKIRWCWSKIICTIAKGLRPRCLSHVSLRYLAYLNLANLFKNETILIQD